MVKGQEQDKKPKNDPKNNKKGKNQNQNENPNQANNGKKIIGNNPNYTLTIQGGQITENQAEKMRKQIRSSDPIVLKNYGDTLGLSILQIMMTLYSGVEPTQILEFIDYQYLRFLQILSLMMMDDEMSIVSSDKNIINHSCTLINQQIPRSFSYGLKKLRQKRGITDPNSSIQLEEIDVRCLYISYLLLIGVGEISPKLKSRQKNESIQHHFHRLVTHLLKKNELLTPKLFYMIEKNWHRIMGIIYNQLEQDKSEQMLIQRKQEPKIERTSTLAPVNQTQRKQLMNQKQKEQVSTGVKESQCTLSHDRMQDQKEKSQFGSFLEDDLQFNEGNWRYHDHETKLIMSEKKKDFQTDKQREKRFLGTVERKKQRKNDNQEYEKETLKPNEKRNSHKKQEDYFAIYQAQMSYNYQKKFTVYRTKQKKIQKEKEKKVKDQKLSKKQSKAGTIKTQKDAKKIQRSQQKDMKEKMIEEFRLEDSFQMGNGDQNLHSEPKYIMDESEDNFYFDMQSRQDYGQRVLTSEGDQSSERMHMVENQMRNMNVQSENISPASNTENSQLESQTETNPNRAVRHENREIDHLVDLVLRNREYVIETIASHIYFELVVWNVKLKPSKSSQEKDSCCRNLFKQYKEHQ